MAKPRFIPSQSYTVSRSQEGYVFKRGPKGNRYYLDAPRKSNPSCTRKKSPKHPRKPKSDGRFIPSSNNKGFRKGFIFSKGLYGMGYYVDDGSLPNWTRPWSKLDASALKKTLTGSFIKTDMQDADVIPALRACVSHNLFQPIKTRTALPGDSLVEFCDRLDLDSTGDTAELGRRLKKKDADCFQPVSYYGI